MSYQHKLIDAKYKTILEELDGLLYAYTNHTEENKRKALEYLIQIVSLISEYVSEYNLNIYDEISSRYSICCVCGQMKKDLEMVEYKRYKNLYVPVCGECKREKHNVNLFYLVTYLVNLLAKYKRVLSCYGYREESILI